MKPPRWIGAALVGSGILGLCVLVAPSTAIKAVVVVAAFSAGVVALSGICALVISGDSDERAGLSEEEVRQAAARLRAKMAAEAAASSVIQDDAYASRPNDNTAH